MEKGNKPAAKELLPFDKDRHLSKRKKVLKKEKERVVEERELAVLTSESEDIYEQIEEGWNQLVDKIFTEDEKKSYLKLRDEYENEREEIESEYYEKVKRRSGNDFKIKITSDFGGELPKLEKKFEQLLVKKVGLEKARKYIKNRSQFNDKLMKQSFSNKAFLISF